MKTKNNKNIIKQIFFIFIGVVIVGLVFAAAYTFFYIESSHTITLGIEESYTLSLSNDSYSINTTNKNIVSVDGDTITARNTGDAYLYIRYNNKSIEIYKIKVVSAPKEITLSEHTATLGLNETLSITASCKSKAKDFDIIYSTSDAKVATIDHRGMITATGIGECDITATLYNGTSDVCHITVMNEPTDFILNHETLELCVGQEHEITLTFAGGEYSNSVDIASSDDSVIEVDGYTLCAKSQGKCTVNIALYNGLSKSIDITVLNMTKSLSLLSLDYYDVGCSFELIPIKDKNTSYFDMSITVSDPSVIKQSDDNPLMFECLKKGSATITATLPNNTSAKKTINVTNIKSKKINFDVLNQWSALPTGCEVVSLTSVLNHLGFDVSMTTMADKYLPKYSGPYYEVSPNDYFLGDPYSKDGFGCFSGCIVKTAENFFDDFDKENEYVAIDITNCTADNIYCYLYNDVPVITWVTSGFSETKIDGTWEVDGEEIVWMEYEHCLVTSGFDKASGTVTVSDVSGGYSYSVSMDRYERIFEAMGSQAVVILKK